MIHQKPFISMNRIATILGIHHDTASRMLEALELPTLLIGRRWLYRTSDVMRVLREALAHE